MKKVLACLLAMVMLVSLLPLGAVSVSAATSGKTGACKWSLQGSTLTISGSGKMGDYDSEMDEYAPWGMEITKVIIKSGVTSIGDEAFAGCEWLESVSIPSTVTKIGESAFVLCSSLEKIVLPAGLKTIEDTAFSFCTALTTIDIPKGVTEIAQGAFAFCGLTEMVIPANVKEIGDSAFAFCEYLATLTLSEGLESIGEAAFGFCVSLSALTIPDSVTEIGDTAFGLCGIETLTIGKGLTTIGEGVFAACGMLKKVTLPSTVRIVEEGAFDGCVELANVTYQGSKGQAQAMKIEDGNEPLTNAKWTYSQLIALLLILDQSKTGYTPMGEAATASVTATGDGLRYEWWIKNAGQTKYSKSSVTSATYSTKMSAKSKDRLVFCYVYDQYGNRVKSETVRLREAVSITTQPKTAYAQLGQKISVSVEASGDGLRYEWWIKNDGQTKYSKSSVTSATYTTKMSATAKNRYVVCKVYDKYGYMVQTKTVMLRENLSLLAQPKSVSVEMGEEAEVQVVASGDGLRFEWYFKDVGDTKYTKSTTMTAACYSIKMTEARNGRRLICYVYDKYGNRIQANTVVIKAK